MKYAIIVSLILSYAAMASSEEGTYKISCDQVEFVIENINENLPEDLQLTAHCNETYDSMLGGIIKKNFKAEITLSASIPLCGDAELSYNQDYILGNSGAYIGVSPKVADEMGRLLYNYGIDYRFGRSGSAVGTMYSFRSLRFPYCGE